MTIKLYKHQKTSRKFLDARPEVFDMSDPGTGKTAVHGTDFADKRSKGGGCALVMAPKSILTPAWENDMKTFAPDMDVSVAYASNRKEAFEEGHDMYVTNIDASTWLAEQNPKFFKRFSHLIIDESTCYKRHTAARSKAMAKVSKYFEWRRLLSGTPNPNGMVDLWHQMKILDGGRRLGPSFFHYRSSVCYPEQTGPSANHVKWIDRPGAELAVASILRDITIRHELRKCIDMPENVIYNVPYGMTAKHYAYYRKMEDDSILYAKEHKISAVNGAVLYTKLLQIASGAVYSENGQYVLLDSGRYELIADLVQQRTHSIVFFQWQHQKDLLEKEFKTRGITYAVIDGSVTSNTRRSEIVDMFQKGFCNTLLLHPQSTAHGLTLTRATAAIWASPTINAEHWKQGNHRHDRAGQKERTETIVLTAVGTIDISRYNICAEKTERMTNLLEELLCL